MSVTVTRTRSAAIGVLGVVAAGLFLGPVVEADQRGGCSLRQAAGTYGVLGDGTILASNPLGLPAGPFTTAGIAEFRHDGTWSGTQTLSIDGNVLVDRPIGGTWNVTPDCLFSNAEAGSDVDTGRGAVVSGGREIDFMDTSTGIAATFVAKRT